MDLRTLAVARLRAMLEHEPDESDWKGRELHIRAAQAALALDLNQVLDAMSTAELRAHLARVVALLEAREPQP
jgi:hypothetical protein